MNIGNKIGVDDFLLRFSGNDLLERITNPFWSFSNSKETFTNLAANTDSIATCLKKFVLFEQVEADVVLKEISATVKLVKIDTLRTLYKKQVATWNSKFDLATRSEANVLWDPATESVQSMLLRVGEVIEQSEDVFYDSISRELLILRLDKSDVERISTGSDLSKFLVPIVRFSVRRGFTNSKPIDINEMVAPNYLDAYLKNPLTYSKLRELNFFTKSPVVVEDTVIHKRGYYEKEKLYYAGPDIEPRSDLHHLKKVLSSFPLEDSSSFANAMASIVSAVLFRYRLPGKRPITVVRGNQTDLGKSTFVQTTSIIATGEKSPTITYTEREDEVEKQIAMRIKTSYFVFFDNIKVKNALSCAPLERSLTDEICSFRLLGTNCEIRRTNNFHFALTINGGSLGEDLRVRSLIVAMDGKNSHLMDPEFCPQKYALDHRDEILGEVVGMFYRGNSIPGQLPNAEFRKYPEFAKIIGRILTANGIKGFLGNHDRYQIELDEVCSAVISCAFIELSTTGKPTTQQRTPSQWLEAVSHHEGDKSQFNTEIKRWETTLGKRLPKMLGHEILPPEAVTATFCVILKRQVNSSKSGGNNLYSFERHEKAADSRNDSSSEESPAPATPLESGNSEGAGPQSVEGLDTEDVCGTSTPISKGIKEKLYDDGRLTTMLVGERVRPVRGAEPTLPLHSILLPDIRGVHSDRMPSSESIVTCDSLQSTGGVISAQKAFHYEFNGKVFSAQSWAGDSVGPLAALDIETVAISSPLDTPKIVLAAVFNGECVYFIRPEMLASFLNRNRTTRFIVHNSEFELKVLEQHIGNRNLPFELIDNDRILDTLLVARLLSLAQFGHPKNLKGKFTLSRLVKDVIGASLPKEITLNEKPIRTSYGDYSGQLHAMPDVYFHYLSFDVISTMFLYGSLLARVKQVSEVNDVDFSKLLGYWNLLRTAWAAHLTKKIGLAVDQKKVKRNRMAVEYELEVIQAKLKSKYNFMSGKGRNLRLNLQLRSVEVELGVNLVKLLSKKSGQYQYSRRTADLKPFKNHEFIDLYLTFEASKKILSTYVRPFLGVDSCHASIDVLKDTGRVGMSGPALQTIPRSNSKYDIRKQFVARPGHKLIKSDFAGAELVTLAQHCLDTLGKSELANALNSGKDPHAITAASFFGVDPASVTKDQRQYGKVPNFGLPGGAGVGVLIRQALEKYDLSVSEIEATRLRDAWLKNHPEMADFLAAPDNQLAGSFLIEDYPSTRQARTSIQMHIFWGILSGRSETKTTNRQYSQDEIDWAWANLDEVVDNYPMIANTWKEDLYRRKGSEELVRALKSTLTAKISRSGRVRANCPRNSFLNNAFQGRLADIANEAWYELHKSGINVVHFMHDEIISEVPDEGAEALEGYKNRQESVMLEMAKRYCPDVTMKVESAIVSSWGDK